MKQASSLYTCSDCGETFIKGWSDKEAKQENEEMWGKGQDSGILVCDSCWTDFLEKPEVSKRIRH